MDAINALVRRIQQARLEEKLEKVTEELSKRSSGQQRNELLTSKQVAPMVGVTHHKTVELWARKGKIPCVHVGRNLRFRAGDVLLWLEQRKG